MRPHPRIRKTVKWGGAVLCVLIAVVWVGSGWWALDWSPYGRSGVNIGAGSLIIASGTELRPSAYGIGFGVMTHTSPFTWWFDRFNGSTYRYYVVPLWPVLLIFTAATALAWRLDTLARRRARVGLCPHCHYDLRGIAPSALCPECGKAPAPI